MIIYLSGGAGGKEAAQTAAASKGKDIGCLLAFQSRIVTILNFAYDLLRGSK